MDYNYVVAHKAGGFLCRSSNNAYTRTSSLQNALKFTHQKAHNFIKKTMAPDSQEMWDAVAINEIDNPANFEPTPFDENTIDWCSVSKSQCELYKNISQYRINLNIRLSNVDKEICDIQHYIEFFNLDASKGYQAYRMLKQRLVKRRFIKNEILRANFFVNGTASDFSEGKIIKQITALNHRDYEPRVLRELFEIDNVHRSANNITA